MRNVRNLTVFMVDAVLVALAFTLSFLLRFDFSLPEDMSDVFWQGLGIVLLVKPAVFLSMRFYRNLWRYASLRDAINIFKAVSISSLISAFAIAFFRFFEPFPRSIVILDWVLLLLLISSSRLVWRLVREVPLVSARDAGRNVLIFGAGEAGSQLLKEIRRQNTSPYNVVGFVDDNKAKQGMYLDGVPVVGSRGDLEKLATRYDVEEIIIAIPSARGKVLRDIIDNCALAGVRFTTLPTIGEIIGGTISVSQIKNVEIDDLLGRDPVILNEDGIRSYLTGKKILISGAAGSIGSELCRQVALYEPEMLILFDHAETPLFYLERELAARFPDLQLMPLIGDIKIRGRVESIFKECAPDVVFHAAAYKHVSMMEGNPAEAVSNNIIGTRIMADAAHRFGVKDFVMISSDKAVNPTNVMGASKRAAEIYVQALARVSATKFSTVRFGNVLGSNGSVIPLFMEQIKKGGPVTVTDPDVIRYFMTIPEAAQLVLQAGCLGNGGEIFVLDMGEPVRIVDLARELIRLSGLVPNEDIDIVFTGLRPGEKLFEELLIAGEGIMPTVHEKIRIARAVETELITATAKLEHLSKRADHGDTVGIIHLLMEIVPEFKPSMSYADQIPQTSHRFRRDHISSKNSTAHQAKVVSLNSKQAEQHFWFDGR